MTAHAPSITADQFREAIGHFATGVTVITTVHEAQRYGSTASAVSSLSLEPPMLLVCLNKQSSTGQAIHRAGAFAVNILAHGQDELAKRFAAKGEDKFAGLEVESGSRGQPLLEGALAHFECRVIEEVTGGTHAVYLGGVERASTRAGAPLAYYRGRFGRLDLAQDEQAYEQLRPRLLNRSLPIGEPLQIEALATELDAPTGAILQALVKLTGEGLVARGEEGSFVVAPLTFGTVEDAFRARLAVQLGAAALTVGRLDADQLAELRRLMEETMPRLPDGQPMPMERWLEANRRFHKHLIAIASSRALLDAYGRLTIPGIMSRGLLDQEHVGDDIASDHIDLVAAYERDDLAAAMQALRRDAQRAIAVHRDRFEAVGGAI